MRVLKLFIPNLYTFLTNQIEKIGNKMKEIIEATVGDKEVPMKNRYNIAIVTYLNDMDERQYSFKNDTEGVHEGDIVVVESANGMGLLATVHAVIENSIENSAIVNKATKWVVDKIDMERAGKRDDRLIYVKELLKEARKNYDEQKVYEAMAQDNPVLLELVTELN